MPSRDNLIFQSDSYKWTHPGMMPADVRREYYYLESRTGDGHPKTVWFGLQYCLKRYLEGARVTDGDIAEAQALDAWHFARPQLNVAGWQRIVRVHGGRIPVLIRAAPEGLVVDRGNALMTIESTDPELPWVAGFIESLLLKVWYPTSVATRSWYARLMLERAMQDTSDGDARFMLHDFGYRGATSEEAAAIGGAAHLLNFSGTDTLPAIRLLQEYYGATTGMAYSVAASQHSVMTSGGPEAEYEIARRIIASHPNQTVSLVADSYDYYAFVDAMIDAHDLVKSSGVRLVIRPDSITPKHRDPESVVVWTLKRLDEKLGATTNAKGFRVVPYGVLWGDGIDAGGIARIVAAATGAGYAAGNLVFGMGGGLLQKDINRDTYRFAIKCSARDAGKGWEDVQKRPLDESKRSKAGRFSLVQRADGRYVTEPAGSAGDILQPVFENGAVLRDETFNTIRLRAQAALSAELLTAIA
jgi:nicotinamide phosphoribosyltransferase